jgi:hypothetical protein
LKIKRNFGDSGTQYRESEKCISFSHKNGDRTLQRTSDHIVKKTKQANKLLHSLFS